MEDQIRDPRTKKPGPSDPGFFAQMVCLQDLVCFTRDLVIGSRYTSRCLNASGTSLYPFDFTAPMMRPMINQHTPTM